MSAEKETDEIARLLVGLARQAVESYVGERRIINPPEETIPELQQRAGVFICLKKFGELRGCIGTFEPTKENLAAEIIHNAISSAARDPRFPPVSPDELESLAYTVDVLSPYERVVSIDELDPKRYGVIVQSGMRRGLLLPNLDGVDNAGEQVAIASRKAGIWPGEPINIFRFEVVRYEG